MKFAIKETMSGGMRTHSTYETFAEARAYAVANFAIAFIEDDAEFPGEAADFLTTGGIVYAVERI